MATKLRLRPRVLTASAATGRNVHRLLQETISLADRRAHRVPTPELNRFLSDVVERKQPPNKQGKRLNMLFMSQTGTRPPRFSIQVNSRQRLTRDYAYFVENRLRERYRLEGDPGDHRLRRARHARPSRRGAPPRARPGGAGVTPRRRWAGMALAAFVTTALLLLAGCGGGSDGPPSKTAAFVPARRARARARLDRSRPRRHEADARRPAALPVADEPPGAARARARAPRSPAPRPGSPTPATSAPGSATRPRSPSCPSRARWPAPSSSCRCATRRAPGSSSPASARPRRARRATAWRSTAMAPRPRPSTAGCCWPATPSRSARGSTPTRPAATRWPPARPTRRRWTARPPTARPTSSPRPTASGACSAGRASASGRCSA